VRDMTVTSPEKLGESGCGSSQSFVQLPVFSAAWRSMDALLPFSPFTQAAFEPSADIQQAHSAMRSGGPNMNVRVVQIITGLACTFFFLALALSRVQLGSVGSALTHANPTWIGAAIVAYAVNLSLRTRRWQIILHPVAAVPYRVVGRAAATLAQLCLLFPVALVATGLLVHGSGRLLSSMLKGRSSDPEATRPEPNQAAGP